MKNESITIQDVKEVFLADPTIEDVRNKVDELKELMGWNKSFPYQKITVKFISPVNVRVNRRKVKELSEMKVDFFDSQIGNYCYTFSSATGYPLDNIDYRKIVSLSIYGVETDAAKAKKRASFLKKFHPNAWTDIQFSKERISEITDYQMKTQSIKSRFPYYVIEDLKKAFENRTKYSYRQPGDKWDLSLETKLCEDGVFRAWYSCEYSGCGNGHYYSLINPTTAAMREDD